MYFDITPDNEFIKTEKVPGPTKEEIRALVISKVKDNPYTLSEVPGIGWKKADEIAQKGGVEPYCIERIESYMCYYLEKVGSEGRSYISPQELMDAIVENIGEEVPDLNISKAIPFDITGDFEVI